MPDPHRQSDRMAQVDSGSGGDWQQRLALIVDIMRDMSRHNDPQEMVRAYGERMRHFMPNVHRISLSRRGLDSSWYRITRSTTWTREVNPWKEKDRLPLFQGGFLADLIYSGEPRVFDKLHIADDEPAAEYLAGFSSLVAIPMYDQGESVNLEVFTGGRPADDDRTLIVARVS